MSVIRRLIPRRSDVTKEMERDLEFANNEAVKGYVDSMRRFLDDALEKAGRLRVDIGDRAKATERVGYTNAVKLILEQASYYAKQGNSRVADLYLQMAEHYATYLDESFKDKVRDARAALKIEPSK